MKIQPARNSARPGAPVPTMATKTATPTTPPIWRDMLKSALPVAARSGGSGATAAPASTGNVRLTPSPMRTIAGSITVR